jgi:hypothetical protein
VISYVQQHSVQNCCPFRLTYLTFVETAAICDSCRVTRTFTPQCSGQHCFAFRRFSSHVVDRTSVTLIINFNVFFLNFFGWGRPQFGLLYQLQMIDERLWSSRCNENWQGNRNTRRKPAPLSLCPPQIPHDLTKRGVSCKLMLGCSFSVLPKSTFVKTVA